MMRRLTAWFAALGLAALAAAPVLAQAPATRATVPVPARQSTPLKPSPSPVPAPASPPASPTASLGADAKRVDLNSASEADLDTLPGIGPARAKAIVANRPYDTVDAVVAKKAVPAGVLSGMRGRVALANINTSAAKDLQSTLPGIGDVRAGQIVAGRPYASPGDLVAKGVLTQAAYDKIKDLVTY